METRTDKAVFLSRFPIRVVDDDRDLDQLPEEFLPGMLLEVTLPDRRP